MSRLRVVAVGILLVFLSGQAPLAEECNAPAILAPNPYTNWSLLSQQEQYLRLVRMLGMDGKFAISVNEIKKKDKLTLGINIASEKDGDRTVLLEYEIQSQRSPRRALLKKIELLKPNTDRDLLIKSPLDPVTAKPKNFIIVDQPALTAEVSQLAFPDVIVGMPLERLLKNIPGSEKSSWLDFLSPQELREKDLNKLKLIGYGRYLRMILNWQLAKRSIGIVVFGTAAIYFGQDIKDYLPGVVRRHESNEIVEVDKSRISSLIDSIRANKQIPDSDRAYLLSRLERDRAAKPTSTGIADFKPGDVDIALGIDGKSLWVRQRSTGKIFVGSELPLNLVEVSKGDIPETYALAMGFFPINP